MKISENVCPVCKQKNEPEAVVCRHCGAALEDRFMDPGARTKTTDMQALTPEQSKDWSPHKAEVPEGGIAIYVEGASRPASIESGREFVMGRRIGASSDGLLDLSPWGGYHLGLSRKHAIIRKTERSYEVLDLGSVNGTWLNDERLAPHKPYPLPSGSQLRLGRMRLFVLYRPVAE
jgi:pSer/pThr/pTyr-binding forkhead associated (FHA) protein